jgi:hypothetical protein
MDASQKTLSVLDALGDGNGGDRQADREADEQREPGDDRLAGVQQQEVRIPDRRARLLPNDGANGDRDRGTRGDRAPAGVRRLSDRIGRRPVNIASTVFTILWAYPYFLLLNTGEPVVAWFALLVGLPIGLGPMIAIQPAFYAELFGARVRYSGFAASREMGAAIAGSRPRSPRG